MALERLLCRKKLIEEDSSICVNINTLSVIDQHDDRNHITFIQELSSLFSVVEAVNQLYSSVYEGFDQNNECELDLMTAFDSPKTRLNDFIALSPLNRLQLLTQVRKVIISHKKNKEFCFCFWNT